MQSFTAVHLVRSMYMILVELYDVVIQCARTSTCTTVIFVSQSHSLFGVWLQEKSERNG